jgi:hypothetical protein
MVRAALNTPPEGVPTAETPRPAKKDKGSHKADK